MDLLCVECHAGYYTAGRFARDLECSACGGALVVNPAADGALVDADSSSPVVTETAEASAAR